MTTHDKTAKKELSEEEKLLEEQRQIRQQNAEAKERREKEIRLRELRESIETEKRAALETEKLEAAEKEHGPKRVSLVVTDLGGVIVKAPHEAAIKRWQDQGGSSTEDFDKLIRPCLLYPEREDFDRMLREQPGIRVSVAMEILKLAGFKLQEQKGKS